MLTEQGEQRGRGKALGARLTNYLWPEVEDGPSRAVTWFFGLVAIVLIVDFVSSNDTPELAGVTVTTLFILVALSLPVGTRFAWPAITLFLAGSSGYIVVADRVGLITLVMITLAGVLGALAKPRVLIMSLVLFFGWGALASQHLYNNFSYLAPLALFMLPSAAVGYVLNRTRSGLINSRRANRELERRQQEIRDLERESLARDLHDVVAHQLTVISLVSGSRLRSEDPEKLKDALREVNETSRDALVELRTLLKVLRGADQDPMLFGSPRRNLSNMGFQEGVDNLESTLLSLGFKVAKECTPDPCVVIRASTAESALRILQESCTNVAKHAEPNSEVRLRVNVADGWLSISVDSRTARVPRVPGTDDALSSGQGVLSIRERAELLGGTATVGRVSDTWSVRANLPL